MAGNRNAHKERTKSRLQRRLSVELLEPRFVLSVFYDFDVVVRTGTGPNNFSHLGQGPSLNDSGYVAFQAESNNSVGEAADNIYVFNPLTNTTKQLMNSVFMYPNVGVQDSVAGTGSISGQVQINNNNQVLGRRRLNALIAVGGPLGVQSVAPLTYLEIWNADGTNPPGLPTSQVANGIPAAITAPSWFFINPVTGGTLPTPLNYSTAFEGLVGSWSINDDGRAAYGAILGNGQGSGNSLIASPQATGFPFLGIGTSGYQAQPVVSNPRVAGNANTSTIVLRNGDATKIFKLDFNLGGIQEIAGAATGFTNLGKPGVSDDGEVIAFAGVNAAGPGIFVSLNSPTGFLPPTRIVGNEGFLGYDDVGNPISFASIDLENRVGVVRKPGGAAGLTGDSLTISFIATPSSASRDNPAIAGIQPFLFSAQRGLWTVTADIEPQLDPISFPAPTTVNPTSPIPVIQVGDQLAGHTISDIKISDSMSAAIHETVGGVTSPRPAGGGRADHRIAFWAQTSGGEMIVTGDHLDDDGDGLLNHWEREGVDIDRDGSLDLNLPALGANPLHKDLFLEIDRTNDRSAGVTNGWSTSLGSGVTHRLVDMFANSPVSNPDGTMGITLHIDAGPGNDPNGKRLSQNLPATGLQGGDIIGVVGNPSAPLDLVYFGESGSLTAPGLVSRSLHDIKNTFFGTTDKWARELVFKYAVVTDFSNIFLDTTMAVFTSAVTVATASNITVSNLPPTPGQGILEPGNYVKVLTGAGAGQIRQVGSVVGNTIAVTAAWSTVPNATSTVAFLSGSSGRAEVYFRPGPDYNAIPGNDLLVSALSWIPNSAPAIQSMPARTFGQWRTLVHELGHTLALRHGGINHVNNNPPNTYKSLMSYTHQLIKTSSVNSYSNLSDPTFNDWAYVKLDFKNSLATLGNSFRKNLPNYEGDETEEVVPIDIVSPGTFVVTSIEMNGSNVETSRPTTIDVFFNQDSNLPSLISSSAVHNAVEIHGLSEAPGEVNLSSGSHFAWDSALRRLRIDLTNDGFGGSNTPLLISDNYELRLNAAMINMATTATPLSDTDGLNDGVYRFRFFQLPGDYNANRVVDPADYSVWRTTFGLNGENFADGNGDSNVDAADYVVWRKHVGAALPSPASANLLSNLFSPIAVTIPENKNSLRATAPVAEFPGGSIPLDYGAAIADAAFLAIGETNRPIDHALPSKRRAPLLSAGSDHSWLLVLYGKSVGAAPDVATDAAIASLTESRQEDSVESKEWDDISASNGRKTHIRCAAHYRLPARRAYVPINHRL